MTKRSRYFLIFVCMAAFFVIAPFVVLYVRGVTYDRQNNKVLTTGLLSVRTDPKDVQVFLNNELTDKTPADIRFLKTGGYNVSLQKDGYRSWSKRIEVTAGKVSWASPGVEKIILFLDQAQSINIAEGVSDFKKLSSGWLYLTPKNLLIASDEAGTSIQSYILPKTVNKISAEADNNVYLLTGDKTALLFFVASGTFKDISGTYKNVSDSSLDSDGNLWLLKNGQLTKMDISTLVPKLVAKDVLSFYILGSTPYYVQKSTTGQGRLFILSQSDEQFSSQVIANVPTGKQNDLGVTNQKEIFILTDGDLYRINDANEKLQSGIINWYFNGQSRTLLVSTASELDFYNFIHSSIQLISRSSSGFTTPQLDDALSYVFYGQGGQITAAELDTFDHQNTYNLWSVSDGAKFEIDSQAKQIFLLDKGSLKTLKIR